MNNKIKKKALKQILEKLWHDIDKYGLLCSSSDEEFQLPISKINKTLNTIEWIEDYLDMHD